MTSTGSSDPVERVRRFNRGYTAAIGVLKTGLPDAAQSLAQARVFFEIATRRDCTASQLCEVLAMDAGHLSRLLASLARAGLVGRERSADDRRVWQLSVTVAGRKAFAGLERASRRQVRGQLRALPKGGQNELIGAMGTIERLLGLGPAPDTASIAPVIALRGHRPGDIGWIVHRQMILYGREYGWDNTYESLIARIGAQFIEDFDPQRAGGWIAHRGETILGSVFLVRRSQTVGQLRLLYVEPDARGQGVGDRLVQACIDRASEIGYRRLMLWTNDILTAARRIYERKGFVQVSEERHHSFGHDLIGQNWSLKLSG